MEQVDAVIIGSGQGGVPLAIRLSQLGKQVVLFERSRMGGSCINYGCTPSKAFLASAHAAGRARKSKDLGINVQVDFPRVMERVRNIRDRFTQGNEDRLRKAGVEIIRAEASFNAKGNVHGNDHLYSAPLIVIDTGSSPIAPPVDGLDNIPFLTDRNFWELDRLPERTLILGAGYIGLELGQGLARLGSRVFIIDRDDRPLGREEPDIGAILKEALERDGVTFHLNTKVNQAEYREEAYLLHLDNGIRLEGDALLVAAGRKADTKPLNAEEAGIEVTEKGFIKVNERFETTRSGVYAIGEAAGQPAFTHVSWEDHRRLLSILDGGPRTAGDRVLGYAAFTDPQVARAGLSRQEAEQKGIPVAVHRMEVKDMARAIEWGHDLGFYEIIADPKTNRILGATLVGYEAGELVHVLLDLIETKATWQQLEAAQHIHPTYAENLPSIARMFQKK